MLDRRVCITGAGSHVPESSVSNEELCITFNAWAQAYGGQNAEPSSPEFIEKVSGIRSRFLWDKVGVLAMDRMCPDIPDRPDEEASVQADFALSAARKAIAESGRAPEDIDLCIVGASSLQRPYPAIAIEVQSDLGASGFAFDVSVGCSSGVYAIQLAHDAIALGRATCALVCVPEIPSAYANWKDRDSHFILGDASAAVVLEADRPGFEILSCSLVSKYSNNVRNNCGFLNRCDADRRDDADKLFYQEGRRVFRDIVKLVPNVIETQLGELKLTASDVGRFWLHQANARLNAAIGERLVGASANGRLPTILETHANTAAAGALVTFDKHRDGLRDGDYGVVCAFGAGYTVGSLLLRKRS